MVDLMYCSTHRHFCQSSSSDLLTLVVSNSTAVWVSFLTQVVANKSCATELWNEVAQSSSKNYILVSSLTVNRCSAYGVATLPCVVS